MHNSSALPYRYFAYGYCISADRELRLPELNTPADQTTAPCKLLEITEVPFIEAAVYRYTVCGVHYCIGVTESGERILSLQCGRLLRGYIQEYSSNTYLFRYALLHQENEDHSSAYREAYGVKEFLSTLLLHMLLSFTSVETFHGSCIAFPNTAATGMNAVMILGDKGAGKSTTAIVLNSLGFTNLSDDYTCIRSSEFSLEKENSKAESNCTFDSTKQMYQLTVLSGYPCPRLNEDVVSAFFPHRLKNTQKEHPEASKLLLSEYARNGKQQVKTAELKQIIVLEVGETPSPDIAVHEVNGLEKFQLLQKHRSIIPGMGQSPRQITSGITNLHNIPLYRIIRPREPFSKARVLAVADTVLRLAEAAI